VPAAVFICEKCHKFFPSNVAVRKHLQACISSGKQPLSPKALPLSSDGIVDPPGDGFDLNLERPGGASFIPNNEAEERTKSRKTKRSGRVVDTTAINADKKRLDECQHCGLVVSNISLHLGLHASPIPGILKCVYSGCKKSHFTPATLKIHLLIRHKLREKSFCQVCGRIFSALHSLYSHRRQHVELRKFDCKDPDCIFTGNAASELKMHKCMALKDVPNANKCKFCGRDFKKTMRLLKSHMLKHETKKPRVLQCVYQKCTQMTFTTKADLKKHVRNKHWTKKKVCDVCGDSFENVDDLAKHRSKHAHCQFPDCNYIGNNCSDLLMHEQSEHSATAGLCHYCCRDFKTSAQLKSHIAKHKSSKRGVYRCVHQSCALISFTSIADVKKHVADKHPNKQKLLLCDVCCCSFVSSKTLAAHKEQHSQQNLSSSDHQGTVEQVRRLLPVVLEAGHDEAPICETFEGDSY
jgi:hypothetical protein